METPAIAEAVATAALVDPGEATTPPRRSSILTKRLKVEMFMAFVESLLSTKIAAARSGC